MLLVRTCGGGSWGGVVRRWPGLVLCALKRVRVGAERSARPLRLEQWYRFVLFRGSVGFAVQDRLFDVESEAAGRTRIGLHDVRLRCRVFAARRSPMASGRPRSPVTGLCSAVCNHSHRSGWLGRAPVLNRSAENVPSDVDDRGTGCASSSSGRGGVRRAFRSVIMASPWPWRASSKREWVSGFLIG
jgi:hypothetical protein